MVSNLVIDSVETTMYVDYEFDNINHKFMVITSFSKRRDTTVIKNISKIYNGYLLKKSDNKKIIKEIAKYLGYE